MRTHIFLLFFIVGATFIGVHARPAEDDDHEGNAPPSGGIHVVLRSIRPDQKFNSALLKEDSGDSSDMSDESSEATVTPSSEESSEESSDEDNSGEQSSNPLYMILSILQNLFNMFLGILGF